MITLVVSGIDWTEALGSDIAGAAVQLSGEGSYNSLSVNSLVRAIKYVKIVPKLTRKSSLYM